jgi:hypothetical protein
MGTKNYEKDMDIQGLILEDFWWKNFRIWSWDGGYTDHQGLLKKGVWQGYWKLFLEF